MCKTSGESNLRPRVSCLRLTAVAIALGTLACGSKSPSGASAAQIAGAGSGAAGMSGATVAGSPAGAGAPAVAGSPASSVGRAGSAGSAGGAAGSNGAAGQSVAGGGGSVAGAGGGAGQAAAGAGAGGMQGPTAGGQAGMGIQAGQGGAAGGSDEQPDYAKPGPYKVTVEKNVGEKFRNTSVYDDSLDCNVFIGGLAGGDPNADPEVIKKLTSYPSDMDRGLYTLFRPETLEADKKYPVLTWGNGTCSQPLLFEELLTHVASHGFIIIASNWRWVASGREMLHGIDFILGENTNSSSALFGKIDTAMLGAFGHSQGSMATVVVGADKRIVTTVPIEGANTSDVANLKGPSFLIAGELDMIVDPASVEQAFNAAKVPAVFGLSMGHDHLMPGLDPSPILKAVTAWFKIHLAGDQRSRDLFFGDPCGLCNDPTWKIRRKNI
jgi:hypothetical protein